jgi:HPt (histidine-containing phosphotransfer) domain-containing protein
MPADAGALQRALGALFDRHRDLEQDRDRDRDRDRAARRVDQVGGKVAPAPHLDLADLGPAAGPAPSPSPPAAAALALPPSDTGFEHLPAFASFRGIFLAALAQRVVELEAACALADWRSVAAAAHNLKGSGGTFGFPEVSLHATAIESAARAADAAAVSAALARLHSHAAGLIGSTSF